ncbi:uncharacterized protein LOC106071400 isoform X1 [Biomphalaria glabrata]|uniref:Uncharacterized protein LOC106071400 isoform X1 n=1 Tax=Biomphalaria glabrata TaxID=6526 RepID=A0A9U8EGJ6_BIOGL|nr:uncharacterized protein LOC106071400 isoform X1 [Biomphalaria glabrata]
MKSQQNVMTLDSPSILYKHIANHSERQGSVCSESLSVMGINHSTAQRRHKKVEMVNVSLIHHGLPASEDTCLGVVIIPVQQWQDLRLPTLRVMLRHQLSQVVPQRFIFYSKARYEIQYAQEKDILCSQICDFNNTILIRNSYDLPKLFVKNHDDTEIYGHIFSTFCSTLVDVRDTVISSCSQVAASTSKFHFLHPDGSLIPVAMETRFNVHHILRKHEIRIFVSDHVSWDSGDTHTQLKRKSFESVVEQARAKTLRLSFTSSKDIDRKPTDETAVRTPVQQDSKQLLISYVRAEAAEHAVNLKRKLTEIGFSVYLDVHEIKSGIDWQDSLNYAVSNCQVFIPLVTPRYGETQWTNREVKLADVLGKPILPISFLEEWPPRCLAIQFATTQFIRWKTQEQIEKELAGGKGADARDIRLWDHQYIEFVAKEIEHRLKTMKSGQTSMSKPALTRMKTLLKTFAGRLPANATPVITSHDTEEMSGPKIVICVHPDQANFAFELRGWLEEAGHNSWVSAVQGEPLSLGDADKIRSSQVVDLIALKKETSKNIAVNTGLYITPKQVQVFQEAVDKAALVIIILSKAFTQSKLCLQQVFYCEHRKLLLPVLYDEFRFPSWLKMLIRTKRLIDAKKEGFRQALLMQVERGLDPTAKNCLETDSQEANIALAVHYVKKSLQVKECVYVTGTSKILSTRSEDVCKSIGRHLAKLDNLFVVTGGCYGTSELVAKVFNEDKEQQGSDSNVWHILPEMEAQNVKEHYNQGADGTFALKDFGKTLFCGNSLWEREAIAGRCFQICLLIEGGTHSAHEVEEFVWSDHIVVPVCCSNGATVGDVKISDKMYQMPPGVNERDWKCLNDPQTSAEEIGLAVSRVITGLLQHCQNQVDSPRKSRLHQTGSIPEDPESEEAETSASASESVSLSPTKKNAAWIAKLRSLQTFIHPH